LTLGALDAKFGRSEAFALGEVSTTPSGVSGNLAKIQSQPGNAGTVAEELVKVSDLLAGVDLATARWTQKDC